MVQVDMLPRGRLGVPLAGSDHARVRPPVTAAGRPEPPGNHLISRWFPRWFARWFLEIGGWFPGSVRWFAKMAGVVPPRWFRSTCYQEVALGYP